MMGVRVWFCGWWCGIALISSCGFMLSWRVCFGFCTCVCYFLNCTFVGYLLDGTFWVCRFKVFLLVVALRGELIAVELFFYGCG